MIPSLIDMHENKRAEEAEKTLLTKIYPMQKSHTLIKQLSIYKFTYDERKISRDD